MRITRFLAAALTAAALAGSALAQTDTASIVGTVKDGTGAVLPGVTVTATQKGTNVVNTAVTNSAGQYVFPNLRIGTYDVAAELQGFRRTVRTDILLNVQDRAEVNLTLEVGQLSEEVVVRGETPLLQTESASIGYSVDERQLRDLPLLGRRYAELAFLTPGSAPAPSFDPTKAQSVLISSAGQLGRGGNITIDGMDNNDDVVGGPLANLPQDAVEEFQMATGRYSAEQGRSAAAAINVVTKSGTDTFQGTLSVFFRDDALQGLPATFDRSTGEAPPFDRQQYSATLGGPIAKGEG